MAVRRTIDSLAKEYASLRGVSADNAVRIALAEAIQREDDSEDPEIDKVARAVRAVVARQITIAHFRAEEDTRTRISETMVPPIVLGLLWLTGAAFIRLRLQAVVLATVLIGAASIYYSYRSLRKGKLEAERVRATLRSEITELGASLPGSLEFLVEGTAENDSFWLTQQDDDGTP